MYLIDNKDRVVPLNSIPQSSVGSPNPIVLSDKTTTVVAYDLEEDEIENNDIAIITFKSCRSIMFGPPGDEIFEAHPLSSRGLERYSTFIIEDSSWLRILIKMNSVHPRHKESHFEDLRHFILSFHDSTFECIAEDFEVETINRDSNDIISIMRMKL
ncbi:hypothetical protein [Paenisporosarcina indica]|uniref:hypothetical protein n=1 Tax=Paenisporosarcina indica TaxID=650093 RepID=UPI00094FDD76|nr:hypothetical protein [Paenisporosarcina indica]